MPSDIVIIFRLVLAAVLGGLVGLEREVNGREAGIRTYLFVSLGSAFIMVLSQYLPHQTELGQAAIDPSRFFYQKGSCRSGIETDLSRQIPRYGTF